MRLTAKMAKLKIITRSHDYDPRLMVDLESENDLFSPLFIAAPVNCCATRHKFSRYPYLHTSNHHLGSHLHTQRSKIKVESVPSTKTCTYTRFGERGAMTFAILTPRLLQKTDVFRAVRRYHGSGTKFKGGVTRLGHGNTSSLIRTRVRYSSGKELRGYFILKQLGDVLPGLTFGRFGVFLESLLLQI